MLQAFFRIRFITILAVIAGMLAALLAIVIGGTRVYDAFTLFLGLHAPRTPGNEAQEAIIEIVEALDNFLLGFVLIYFSYGTYFLFIQAEAREETRRQIRIPNWMHVESIGQMKRVLLEVILVLLSVFMLKLVLIEQTEIDWTILVLPAMIIAIAISLRLVRFD